MTKLLADPRILDERRQFTLFDDFFEFDDTETWTETSPDTGASVALDADAVGGVIQLITGAVDNNEAYLETTSELFKFADDKPLVFEARVQFAEANTDDANVLIGLMDAPGADSLLDDGDGPKASYSGCVFYKVDGGTRWQTESSVGGTQHANTTSKTAGGASYHSLRIEVQPISSTVCEVTFWIDDAGGQDFEQCLDNTTGQPIKHRLTYTSATEMALVVGVKAGGGNSETINVDYIACSQLR